MKKILTYKKENDKCPYDDWFLKQDKIMQVRIVKRLERVEEGNYGDYKKIDNEISELRLVFGSGYRIYFTENKDTIVILLCAGDKNTQTEDIKKAKKYLKDLQERTK